MGRRGPKPKPIHLRVLDGSRGLRPDHGPKVGRGRPTVPKHFDKSRVLIWRAIVERLIKADLLTRLDGWALELLVECYAEYKDAVRNTDQKWQESREKQLLILLREFGLTPASRSRVSSATDRDEKPADKGAKYFA